MSTAWTMPVAKGRVTAKYKKPGAWAAGFHTGVDFGVPSGTPVVSVGPGRVVTSAFDGSYGNYVVIQMADGCFTLYAHLSERQVGEGAAVGGGQQLGLSGATGNVTGPHLHFEVRRTNSYHGHTDPIAYLAGHGVARAKRSGGTVRKAAIARRATVRKKAAAAKPRLRSYTVKAGDTLSKIASVKLGRADRYGEIATLNGIADPNLIQVGLKLKIPPA